MRLAAQMIWIDLNWIAFLLLATQMVWIYLNWIVFLLLATQMVWIDLNGIVSEGSQRARWLSFQSQQFHLVCLLFCLTLCKCNPGRHGTFHPGPKERASPEPKGQALRHAKWGTHLYSKTLYFNSTWHYFYCSTFLPAPFGMFLGTLGPWVHPPWRVLLFAFYCFWLLSIAFDLF